MNSQPDLGRAPLLIHEVLRIHVLFISITLAIFAILTWQSANELATAANPLAISLAAALGLFWLARSVVQWSHHSGSHSRGETLRTAIHCTLFLGYGAMASVYLAAAFWRNA